MNIATICGTVSLRKGSGGVNIEFIDTLHGEAGLSCRCSSEVKPFSSPEKRFPYIRCDAFEGPV